MDVWAVASNGDALYRSDVRLKCPEGSAWIHVPSDSQFQSISVGGGDEKEGKAQVWALATDGSAFLRHGVSDVAPTGQFWLQVHQPQQGPDAALRFEW